MISNFYLQKDLLLRTIRLRLRGNDTYILVISVVQGKHHRLSTLQGKYNYRGKAHIISLDLIGMLHALVGLFSAHSTGFTNIKKNW